MTLAGLIGVDGKHSSNVLICLWSDMIYVVT